MTAAWAHPLARAVRTLTLRIQALERDKDATLGTWNGWPEYIAACDAVARLIQVTTAPPERITRGALGARFSKKAQGG